jgi:DNA-binding Lrp family transcriptional regulator
MYSLDALDARLLATLRASPRLGLMEASRRLGVARGTAQARLDKLARSGVLTGFGPDVEPARMGYPILAFVYFDIQQGRLRDAVAELERVPEVLEAFGMSGPHDLLCRVVAHDPEHLQELLNHVLNSPVIRRSTTNIVLSRQIALRTGPLEEAAGSGTTLPAR